MNLYLALSCLQGRPMRAAFDELVALGADGIQLTAGNAPTVGFAAHVAASGVPVRAHHGFDWGAMRRPVWDAALVRRGHWDSVHPPQQAPAGWLPDDDGAADVCYETMYPGYPLGTGAALEAAMSAGVRLAADVSHLHLQFEQGVLRDSTWRRLQQYEHVGELHLSAGDGRRDGHRPLTTDAFGLAWVQERSADGVPVVLESYLHRLDQAGRARQLTIARGKT